MLMYFVTIKKLNLKFYKYWLQNHIPCPCSQISLENNVFNKIFWEIWLYCFAGKTCHQCLSSPQRTPGKSVIHLILQSTMAELWLWLKTYFLSLLSSFVCTTLREPTSISLEVRPPGLGIRSQSSITSQLCLWIDLSRLLHHSKSIFCLTFFTHETGD